MRTRLIILGLALLFTALTVAASEPAAATQQQGPARLVVEGAGFQGKTLELSLSGVLRLRFLVEGPSALEVTIPTAITSTDGWKVRQPPQPPERLLLEGGRVRWQQTFLLDPVTPGDTSLLLSPLRYRMKASDPWETAAWEPIPVHVTTEITHADLKELRGDVLPPEQLPPVPPWPRWPLGVALAVLLATLALTGWNWLRRRRKQVPSQTPHEWALAELARIASLGLPTAGEINGYHTFLSDTLRRYLELRFHLPASRRTTAEFLDAVRSTEHLNAEQQTLLGDFLKRCDLAKFARAAVSEDECRTTATLARTLVEQTIPSTSAERSDRT
jgi:hypothetical protein